MSVTYCCQITPQLSGLKQYLTVCVGQGARHGFAGCFCLKVSTGYSQGITRAAASQGSAREYALLPKLTHVLVG